MGIDGESLEYEENRHITLQEKVQESKKTAEKYCSRLWLGFTTLGFLTGTILGYIDGEIINNMTGFENIFARTLTNAATTFSLASLYTTATWITTGRILYHVNQAIDTYLDGKIKQSQDKVAYVYNFLAEQKVTQRKREFLSLTSATSSLFDVFRQSLNSIGRKQARFNNGNPAQNQDNYALTKR